ncbi:hypothetical protein FKP32DRAFT_1575884 [Trametes sanguinea]|nr:hypothetical protein FKP32DRAFT_1575884 [Trametes sanguinea]
MYLAGVIPGPSKPSLEQLNPYLSLVVDELLEFWDPGVTYSRTSRHLSSHLVRAALIPLICDILAARQVSGLGYHSSTYFCSFCYLTLDDIENFDKSSWSYRTADTHRRHAELWRQAQTVEEQAKIAKDLGVRWSELLRLPYWDPIRFTVVDSMHNLYLGLVKRHCRDIWGMDVDAEDGDGTINHKKKAPKAPRSEDMDKGLLSLYHGSVAELKRHSKAVLWHLCEERDIRRAGTISQMARALDDWVHAAEVQRAEKSLLTSKNIKSLSRYRKAALIALCLKYEVPFDGVRATLATRLTHFQALEHTSAVQAEGESPRNAIPAEDKQSTHPGPGRTQDKNAGDAPKRRKAPALGREAFAAIREIREVMQLPSWINPVPRGFGTVEHGKLSADQWHTACTVLLPVALISLWGAEAGRKHDMLNNFMDLVTAVVFAGMWHLSPEHIDIFEAHMLRYLTQLKELYKEASIVPNHHYSLHLPDYMRFFGPVHGWRAFVFERFNYMLQRLNTNLTFGEMENTFMKSSCRASNLKALLQSAGLQDSLGEFLKTYRALSGEDERGMRLDSILRSLDASFVPASLESRGKPIVLDDRLYAGLLAAVQPPSSSADPVYVDSTVATKQPGQRYLSRNAEDQTGIIIRSIHYRPSNTSPRDSNIQFRRAPEDTRKVAGCIRRIFSHRRKSAEGTWLEEVFLAVEELEELSVPDAKLDNFRKFPLVGGSLYYDRFSPDLRIIRPSQVVCHVARTPLKVPGISGTCVHILPLDRVCLPPPLL